MGLPVSSAKPMMKQVTPIRVLHNGREIVSVPVKSLHIQCIGTHPTSPTSTEKLAAQGAIKEITVAQSVNARPAVKHRSENGDETCYLHPPEKKPYRMANAMSAPSLVAPNIAKMRHPEIVVMGMITAGSR